MKLIAVAQKELLQSVRSLFAIFFMLVVPLLMTGLFFIMFGGGGDEGFSLPQTSVVIVDLDSPVNASSEGAPAMGELLISILQGEAFSELMAVSLSDNVGEARNAVDAGEASVSLVIPANFTAALQSGGESANVEIYQDPALTLGPAIVAGIVGSVIDQFVANQIGIAASVTQMAEAGLPIDEALVGEIVAAHVEASANSQAAAIAVRSPGAIESTSGGSASGISGFLGSILAGMLVFFGFFTGGAALQSILVEEENGTLARLFTTPTSHLAILGGKYASALILLAVQVVVLVAAGVWLFSIYWGVPSALTLAGIGMAVCAATTGLFLVSMMQNTRQGGVVFGGLLTLTGMLGLMPVFTAAVPDVPPLVETVSLFVPQGWAMRGFGLAMDDAAISAVALNTLVLLGWSLVFALIAQYRLKHRFDR